MTTMVDEVIRPGPIDGYENHIRYKVQSMMTKGGEVAKIPTFAEAQEYLVELEKKNARKTQGQDNSIS